MSKKNSWSESQFEKSKTRGNPDTWAEAAESIAPPPTDEEKVRELLSGERYSKCGICGTLKKRLGAHLSTHWLENGTSNSPACPNERCPDYGKVYG